MTRKSYTFTVASIAVKPDGPDLLLSLTKKSRLSVTRISAEVLSFLPFTSADSYLSPYLRHFHEPIPVCST
jgi:hypothetical protein